MASALLGSRARAAWKSAAAAAGRGEREAFLLEACSLMRERFDAVELWRHLDLPLGDCFTDRDGTGGPNRAGDYLFSRIVPTIKAIGLLGPSTRRAFASMGVLHFAASDPADMGADDEGIARGLDERRVHVDAVTGLAVL